MDKQRETDADDFDRQRIRNAIISNPKIILDDIEVIRAIASTDNRTLGKNIVDLRSVAMATLEDRLDKLEATNRTLVATSYENIDSVMRINRAAIRILDSTSVEEFRNVLEFDFPELLNVMKAKLLVAGQFERLGTRTQHGTTIVVRRPREISDFYHSHLTLRDDKVILRSGQTTRAGKMLGDTPEPIRSEALLPVSPGKGKIALLVLASENQFQFEPGKGTELLEFLREITRRTVERLLA